LPGVPGYAAAWDDVRPARSGRNWLQASNPSSVEWDFMFRTCRRQVRREFGPLPRAEVIPMKEVK
jgi:hypothetical protein